MNQVIAFSRWLAMIPLAMLGTLVLMLPTFLLPAEFQQPAKVALMPGVFTFLAGVISPKNQSRTATLIGRFVVFFDLVASALLSPTPSIDWSSTAVRAVSVIVGVWLVGKWERSPPAQDFHLFINGPDDSESERKPSDPSTTRPAWATYTKEVLMETYTERDLTTSAGINAAALDRWLEGRVPSRDRLLRMSERLKVTAGEKRRMMDAAGYSSS